MKLNDLPLIVKIAGACCICLGLLSLAILAVS